MPYRENEDAALARADALQSDLDRAQTELTSTHARLADAERARDQLIRERDAHARTNELVEGMRIPARWDFRRNVLPLILVAAGAVFLILLVSATQASREADHHAVDRAFETYRDHAGLGTPTLCTIHTVPEGARLVAIGPDHVPHALGVTPMSYARRPSDGVVEARLDGYAPVTVVAEPDASGACSATYALHER